MKQPITTRERGTTTQKQLVLETLSRFKSIVMPGTKAQSEIMQPARDFHHQVTDRVLPVANFVLDDTTPLHPTDGVLNPHSLARNAMVRFFLFQRELTTARLLGWLPNGYCRNGKSLKSHVLIEGTLSR